MSGRSDSEPTMCLSLSPALTPREVRRPSITVTKASVERETADWGGSSLCSRLPSNLSLGRRLNILVE